MITISDYPKTFCCCIFFLFLEVKLDLPNNMLHGYTLIDGLFACLLGIRAQSNCSCYFTVKLEPCTYRQQQQQ